MKKSANVESDVIKLLYKKGLFSFEKWKKSHMVIDLVRKISSLSSAELLPIFVDYSVVYV